jgi:hypothetical protein
VDEAGKGHNQNADDIAIEIPPDRTITVAAPNEDIAPEKGSSEALQKE